MPKEDGSPSASLRKVSFLFSVRKNAPVTLPMDESAVSSCMVATLLANVSKDDYQDDRNR